MKKLENLLPNPALRGVLPDTRLTVVKVQWFGAEALEADFQDARIQVAAELLYVHGEGANQGGRRRPIAALCPSLDVGDV